MRKLTIEEVKEIEIDILKYIVSVCEKNELRYYLVAGTLIGAIRHQGFIPWDDDIDIGMPRPDYEKLKDILGDDIHKKRFKLLTFENGGTKYNFMKIVDNRTVLYEKYMAEEVGVWVDIFPIDGLPSSNLLTRLYCYKLEFWRRLLNISSAKKGMATSRKRLFIKSVLTPISKCFSTEFMCRKINQVFKRYDYDKCEYVGAVSGGCTYKGRTKRESYEKAIVFFEGEQYIAPKGSHSLLTQMYGDYMELPPIEKRVQHEFEAYIEE